MQRTLDAENDLRTAKAQDLRFNFSILYQILIIILNL